MMYNIISAHAYTLFMMMINTKINFITNIISGVDKG